MKMGDGVQDTVAGHERTEYAYKLMQVEMRSRPAAPQLVSAPGQLV